jgi:alpha-amylase
LSYAFILTHEGYPCIFWQDYYSWNLGLEGNAQGIAALVRIHEDHAGGTRAILYADHDLYVMERKGWKDQRGLIFVMNNRGDGWNGKRVQTQWRGKKFTPGAWWGHDGGTPQEKWTDPEGYGEFWAPPRGYVVYVPE